MRALELAFSSVIFLNGVVVASKEVATTPTRVEHRLGRVPRGVMVLSATPDAAIGFSVGQPPNPEVGVFLEASAPATFTLWFW